MAGWLRAQALEQRIMLDSAALATAAAELVIAAAPAEMNTQEIGPASPTIQTEPVTGSGPQDADTDFSTPATSGDMRDAATDTHEKSVIIVIDGNLSAAEIGEIMEGLSPGGSSDRRGAAHLPQLRERCATATQRRRPP